MVASLKLVVLNVSYSRWQLISRINTSSMTEFYLSLQKIYLGGIHNSLPNKQQAQVCHMTYKVYTRLP